MAESDLDPLDDADLVRPRPKGIVGVVTERREHAETRRSWNGRRAQRVLTLVIQRQDDEGRALPEISIEMRGVGFHGEVSEGDIVQLPASNRVVPQIHAERLQNLTTGTPITTQGPPLGSVIIGLGALVLVAGVMIAFFLHFMMGSSGS